MKLTGYRYTVQATVSFTGLELLTLFEASRAHYDSRCRSMSHPRDEWGNGGEIWGMLNMFVSYAPEKGEPEEALFTRYCTANADAVITRDLNSTIIDGLYKCTELAPGVDQEVLRGLRFGLKEAHIGMSAEYRRLNPAHD